MSDDYRSPSADRIRLPDAVDGLDPTRADYDAGVVTEDQDTVS